MRKYVLTILFLLLSPLLAFAQEDQQAQSQDTTYKGAVMEVDEADCGEQLDASYKCYQYTVYVDDLDKEVQTMSSMSETGKSKFKIGDKVYITQSSNGIDEGVWNISGFVRLSTVILIVAIFALITVLVGGIQGFGSLLSLAITVALIYFWAVPQMLGGGNIIMLGVITVCVSLVFNMYLSHGFNMKSTVGMLSTIVGIVIVAAMAALFINLLRLDGTGSEDSFLLLSQTGGSIDLSALFFVSILIGAMGVLDDVVMSQVSAIQELLAADPTLTPNKLFVQSMNIGRDHISTMVNTLFIAYAGSSLALVMLFTYNSGGIGTILGTDSIAEEIVRTMAASIGILLVVPITSLLAANILYAYKSRKNTAF